ncbi:SpoIID/LytB domain-containing protein [Radiobacillus kanasensis]|uniref:SpoIID/LytB domain-containing protein n=1 Tax=Radiobacillus kanasensis TaxID=2844358 RepID=UPI001E5F99C3|nr:SpoIID/LytB domain-containing protein [Radiobacillus kanasensis]UFT98878.1 SpoIID/LytB domain-containing protein [Radiobacillus kanasensis]
MKKIIVFFSVLFVFLVFTNSEKVSAASPGLISVKLYNHIGNKSSIDFEVSGTYKITGLNYALKEGRIYTVKIQSGDVILMDGSTTITKSTSGINIYPTLYSDSSFVTVHDSVRQGKILSYYGEMNFKKEGSYVRPYNKLFIEDYLKGVVGFEMYPSWDIEALKAQTLAARTHALPFVDSSTKTIIDSQNDQVYAGIVTGSTYQNVIKAVESTRGQIINYNGNPISAVYSSSNGGKIISNENYGWSNDEYHPYLTTKLDPYDSFSGNSYNNWSFYLAETQIDVSTKDLKRPQDWWSSVSEADSSFINNLKSNLYTNGISKDYELKITKIFGLDLINNTMQSDIVYKGNIEIQYMLRNKVTGEYRKNSSNDIARFQNIFTFNMTTFRSMFGWAKMKSININSVTDTGSQYKIEGSGFGHAVGMSQHGAQNMAQNHGKNYRDILGFYYQGTTINLTGKIPAEASVSSITTDLSSPQNAKDTIRVTANASGGSQLIYQFWVGYQGEWKLIQNYSGKSYVDWTPDTSGNYTLNVHVKDKYSSKDYDDYITKEFVINEPIKVDGLSTSKTSPQELGQTINISASASGSTSLEYKFWAQNIDTNQWILLNDYSSSSTISWLPSESGNYKLVVHVREVGSTKSYDAYRTLDYKISEPPRVNISEITVDKVSPQVTGSNINVTAVATGETTLEYKFWAENTSTGKWTLIRNYGSSATANWTPNVAGDYKLVVHAREVGSSKSYDAYRTLNYKISEPPKINVSNLTVDKASPQEAGTNINVSAEASGGTSLEYKFWAENTDTGKWTLIRNYGSSATTSWTPSEAANYKLVVHVRNVGSTKSYEAYQTLSYVISQPGKITINKVTTDKSSPQVTGTSINVSAEASGGTSLEYKFWAENTDTGKWTLIRNYGSSATTSWTPSEAANYKLVVHVRNVGSTKSYEAYQTLTYVISQPGKVTVNKVTADKSSPQVIGTSINVSAEASGGTSLEYKFWVENTETGEWTLIRDYGASSSTNWLPNQVGTYKLVVHVRDINSTRSYDSYNTLMFEIKE